MSQQLTPEQESVVYHPRGKHARVLAVAGSGKTTTMVYRVKHLVQDLNVSPSQICILMFNRRARVQFQEKLAEVLPHSDQKPEVHTFHSYAYKLIQQASQRGLLAQINDVWIGDREERVRITVHRAIQNLEEAGILAPDSVDIDDAVDSIGLWKGSLIPPERAGHRTNPKLVQVYQEFEVLRLRANAITFDDFIPLAVGILQSEPAISSQIVNSFETVIVDEYQDVNYGQQRFIEILAGTRADVMVVGDDDQTIYEWRGARPEYITQQFVYAFSNKSSIDYTLSRTFRFGPIIAQCAQNAIDFNRGRIKKPLIAHVPDKEALIHIISTSSEQVTDVNKALTSEIFAILKQTADPSQIIVLGRMFAQLVTLEAEFLNQGIPYRVLGRAPFFERREIEVLLHYIRLALRLNDPIDQDIADLIVSVANVPNRKISRDLLTRSAKQMAMKGANTRRLFQYLLDPNDSPTNYKVRSQIEEFFNFLDRIHERLTNEDKLLVGDLLDHIVLWLDYGAHFDNYYGSGENSEDRKRCVHDFIGYAHQIGLNPRDFLKHIETLDTTRGFPEDQLIVMTTIYRVKGEEFDYVILPNCDEGYMPNIQSNDKPIFDLESIVPNPPASDVIESERRLFYVALTRARKGVFIGSSEPSQVGNQASSTAPMPSRFLEEMQLSSTENVIQAFQRTKTRDKNLVMALLREMRQHAAKKPLIENILSEYLPARGIRLPQDIEHSIISVPPEIFTYVINTQLNEKASDKPPKDVETNWWD